MSLLEIGGDEIHVRKSGNEIGIAGAFGIEGVFVQGSDLSDQGIEKAARKFFPFLGLFESFEKEGIDLEGSFGVVQRIDARHSGRRLVIRVKKIVEAVKEVEDFIDGLLFPVISGDLDQGIENINALGYLDERLAIARKEAEHGP